jgi:hypothetical protein
MTADLALLAKRRAGLAALLGVLLLEEPGPRLAELVEDVPALRPLASGRPELAVEYERVLLRGIPLHESVFTSDDGSCGGVAIGTLVERYAELGFTEYVDGRWRVAGPDHLGLQLRCYAVLCGQEAQSWRGGTVDQAVERVEAERSFLADHVAPWATTAVGAAQRSCVGGPYAPVLTATAEFLDEELDRLRPAPQLGDAGEPQPQREPTPANVGPSRLARMLLAPAVCGTWLDGDVLAGAAAAIGAPWRPNERRSALRHLLAEADGSGDLPTVLAPIIAAVERATAHHCAEAARVPGNAATARRWAARSAAMARVLRDVADRGLTGQRGVATQEHLSISGSDPIAVAEAVDDVVTTLRARGFTVERNDGPGSR